MSGMYLKPEILNPSFNYSKSKILAKRQAISSARQNEFYNPVNYIIKLIINDHRYQWITIKVILKSSFPELEIFNKRRYQD